MRLAIGIFTSRLDRLGGYFHRLKTLINGLAVLGNEVVLIQTNWAYQNSQIFFHSVSTLPVKSLVVDFPLMDLRYSRIGFPAFWNLPLVRYIPDDIDLLDLHDPIIRIPARRSYRVVFSHNHFSPYIKAHFRNCGFRSASFLFEIPLLSKMLKGFQNRVDGYITETGNQRQWIIDKYNVPETAVAAVPPGFDLDLIQAFHRTANNSIAEPFIILFSGRVHSWKGVYELLEAFTLIAAKYPNWNLHFVGDGPAVSDLQKKARQKGLQDRVVFWGSVDHPQAVELAAKSDIFVLPSYIESFPLSLLEAMALGVPVIATDVGGIREHLVHPMVTGLLIPPKNHQALSHALVRLISDPEYRTSLGKNGRTKTQGFTNKKMVQSTASFYEKVLAK